MKKIGLVHISDLHITQHRDEDNYIRSESWFNLHPFIFQETVIKQIKKKKTELAIEELVLIISGDLSNKSDPEEYKNTTDFLESLIKECGIQKKNIILVPGNHDINWFENQLAYSKGKNIDVNKLAWEYKEEKFKNFKLFYDDFFRENTFVFNCQDNLVRSHVLEKEKILIIGLNSATNSSFNLTKYGDFDLKKLDEELKDFVLNFSDYAKIAIFHHNPRINSISGKPSFKEWPATKIIFNKYEINTFLFGHEHTYGATSDDNENSNYIATGTLGLKNEINYLNIIEIIEDENSIKLKSHFSKLEPKDKHYHPEFGWWNDLNDEALNKELLLLKRESIVPIRPTSIIPATSELLPQEMTSEVVVEKVIKSEYSDTLLEYVKQKKIFKTGHFHWSADAKSHNWLDIPNLLNTREISLLCQKAIIDLMEKNNIGSELIIGIGMEGCYLGSIAAMQFNIPFTFVPYEYRYKDHDTYETKLNHATVKNITIVTDVVHSGNTIKRLLEYEKEFFNSSEIVNIISLFYTGSTKKEYKVDQFKNINSKIRFYNVCDKISVVSCPHGNDFASKCIVYEKKLDNIYEFYSIDKE